MFPFKSHKEVVHIDETIIIIDNRKYFRHDHKDEDEEKFFEITLRLAKSIENLTNPKNSKAHGLAANYDVVTKSGDIQIFNSKKSISIMAQTIQVLAGQNTVPGQLVPVADDNTTVEPISTINAGSEAYTSSDTTIATVAADPSGVEGAFVVTRVPGANGTIQLTYTAVTPDGRTITNVGGTPDTIVFQGQPTGTASALTATFGTPS